MTLWIDILDHKNYIFLRKFQPYFNKLSKDSKPLFIQSILISPTPLLAAAANARSQIATMMGNIVDILLDFQLFKMLVRK